MFDYMCMHFEQLLIDFLVRLARPLASSSDKNGPCHVPTRCPLAFQVVSALRVRYSWQLS